MRLRMTLLDSGSVLGRIGRVSGTYYCVVEARERDSEASVYHFRDYQEQDAGPAQVQE